MLVNQNTSANCHRRDKTINNKKIQIFIVVGSTRLLQLPVRTETKSGLQKPAKKVSD